jgi:hypothetical protein
MAEKTDGIIAYAKQKNRETIDKVNQAIDLLKRSKTQIVNFETVAKKAGVSRATLYNNPILKERILSLRADSKKIPAENATLPEGKLQLQREKIAILRREIARLKSDKQKLILQLVETDTLRKENDKLKRRLSLKKGIEGEERAPVKQIVGVPVCDDVRLAQIVGRQTEQTLPCGDLREYEAAIGDMTPEERDELRKWAADGHSPYDNPCFLYGEDGRIMDFITAIRIDEDMMNNPEDYFGEKPPEFGDGRDPDGDPPY